MALSSSSFSPTSPSSDRGSCPLFFPPFTATTTTQHFAVFHRPRPPLLSTSADASLRALSNPFSASLAVSRGKTRVCGGDTSFSVKNFYNRRRKLKSAWNGDQACSQASAAGSNPLSEKISELRDSCWRFLRPHTIRGTVLGSIALVARALIESPELINWWLTFKAFYGLMALICGNGYIVGINQIYDIGIDKVNKPYLPIAAGDLSVQSAWFLVLLFAAVGLLIVGWNFGPFISSLYCLGLLLGTIYSVPPFRLKRYPVVAFLIIATVRGFLLNFGVYYATRAALGLSFRWSLPVAFITTFVTVFALVIAIAKDLPDVEGDRKFKISTLATRLGVRNIAFLGSGLLLANYLGAVLVAIYMPQVFRCSIMVPAHGIFALGLFFQAWALEQAKYTKEAISQFYRFIWYLFYAEYIIFPLI